MSFEQETEDKPDARWQPLFNTLNALSEPQRALIKAGSDEGYRLLFNALEQHDVPALAGLKDPSEQHTHLNALSTQLQDFFDLNDTERLLFKGDFQVLTKLLKTLLDAKKITLQRQPVTTEKPTTAQPENTATDIHAIDGANPSEPVYSKPPEHPQPESANASTTWDALWPEQIADQPLDREARYEKLVRLVLGQRLLDLSGALNANSISPRAFQEKLLAFEYVANTVLGDPKTPSSLRPQAKACLAVLKEQFIKFFEWLKRLLRIKESDVDVKLVNDMVRLADRLELLNHTEDQNIAQTLANYYNRKVKQLNQAPYFFESYLNNAAPYLESAGQKKSLLGWEFLSRWSRSDIAFLNRLNTYANKASVDVILSRLHNDLKRINALSMCDGMATWLEGIATHGKKSECYLTAYQNVQKQLRRLSESCVQMWFRHVDKLKLKQCSLETIQYFAEALQAFNQNEVRKARKDWRDFFKNTYSTDPFFEQANTALEARDDETAETLKTALMWVHFTMYAPGRTEGVFGEELKARNDERIAKNLPVYYTAPVYRLGTVLTLSDYLVLNLPHYTRLEKKATAEKTHTDTAIGDEEAKEVSAACFHYLTFLREKTKDMLTIWAKGPYNWKPTPIKTKLTLTHRDTPASATAPEPEMVTLEPNNNEEAFTIDVPKPEFGVDLSFFQLRTEYFNWIKGQGEAGLDKTSLPYSVLNDTFRGNPDDDRSLFVLTKLAFLRSYENLKNNLAEHKKLEELAAKAEAQRQARRHEMELACNKMLTKTLKRCFLNNDPTLSRDFVHNKLRGAVKEVQDIFSEFFDLAHVEKTALQIMQTDERYKDFMPYLDGFSVASSEATQATATQPAPSVAATPGTMFASSQPQHASAASNPSLTSAAQR